MKVSCAHLQAAETGVCEHVGLPTFGWEREKRCSSHREAPLFIHLSQTSAYTQTDTQIQRNWPWLVQIRRPSLEGFSQRGLWGRGSTDVGAASHSANTHNTMSICVCVCVYSWLFMCIYSLLHNGRVVMRGVKGSVPHLIGCWLMTRPWAAFSWAHTCPAKQRNVRAACLQKKRMVVWMKNKCNTIQKCGDSIFFFLNRNKKTIILNSIQINTPLVSIRDLSKIFQR